MLSVASYYWFTRTFSPSIHYREYPSQNVIFVSAKFQVIDRSPFHFPFLNECNTAPVKSENSPHRARRRFHRRSTSSFLACTPQIHIHVNVYFTEKEQMAMERSPYWLHFFHPLPTAFVYIFPLQFSVARSTCACSHRVMCGKTSENIISLIRMRCAVRVHW